MKRVVAVIVLWLGVLGLLAGLTVGFDWLRQGITLPLLPPGQAPITIDIPKGADARRIAELADRAGARIDPDLFALAARLRGQARSIQAGEYQLSSADHLLSFLDRLVAGDVVRYRLTIPEGETAQDFLNALAAEPAIDHTLAGKSHAEILRALGLPIEHLEGWLFPDTYVFTRGTTDRHILREAYRAMRQHLDAAWANRAANLPLENPYQALILASIIEKETGIPAERDEIAGVFINRLRQHMRLQTDPAVMYGVAQGSAGRVDQTTAPKSLTTRELKTDTPYNTYTRYGLPPTPIALPSAAALIAATHPAVTDDLYFVANGSGGHTFSQTLSEHNQAVARWRQREQQRSQPANGGETP
ncbi:endolytic transglycosylase MltG [Halothiobacillus sp. DCM-1]|uniref:endolytic transglycosylase MltG n=1 Tax=Halothiobacillus sp. DCM-1 TaxID=3112558 RepID=UPI00324B35B1